MFHWMSRLLLGSVCALGLMACAQDTRPPLANVPPPPDLLGASAPASAPTGAGSVLRIVVQLKAPTQGTDPAWLRALQDQAQAPVQYVAAVSDDTHVYALLWRAERSTAELLQRLSQLGAVARVELDARNHPH
jgi:hypothetical protein